MIKFKDGEWFEIMGHGNAYACKMPVKLENSSMLLNTEVMIENFVYTVIGVEMYAVSDRTLYVDMPVSILVKGARKTG